MTEPPELRITYRPGQLPGRRKPSVVEAAAGRIVAAWNERIPRGRVRILNRDRYIAVAAALDELSVDEIVATIEFYSRQSWQRQRGAWKTFLNFLEGENLSRWWEKLCEAREAAERRAEAARPQDPTVAAVVDQLANRAVDWRKTNAERFAALPPAKRHELRKRAVARLGTMLGVRPPETVVVQQALAFHDDEMRAAQAAEPAGEGGP